jgi:TrmH family RNA methyltransferase
VITSTGNPRVKAILRLRKRRARDEEGRFVIEGIREVRRALAAGITVGEIVTCPALAPADSESETDSIVADAVAGGAVHTEVAEAVFARLSYRDGPDGVLAVAATFATGLARIERPVAWRPDPLVLVVAGLEKPGNLGAVLRSAAAAGVDAVIAADPVADVFNPNVVRAAQGALFAVPLAVAGADEVRAWLRDLDIPLYAAGPRGAQAPWDLPLARAAALVVGPEHAGLDPAWFAGADATVAIPMPGARNGRGVDSLNAAAATAVLLFEAVRQRAAQPPSPGSPTSPSNR